MRVFIAIGFLAMQLACAPEATRHASSAHSFAPGTEDDTHPDERAQSPVAQVPYTNAPKPKSHAWIVLPVLGGIVILGSAVAAIVVVVNGISSAANSLSTAYHR